MKTVAVLFAHPKSPYKAFDLADVYDEKRDARTFTGELPVVAHPPCRAWGRLRHFAKSMPHEKDLARWAVGQVRQNGGVLEHPAASQLWPDMGLPSPGTFDSFGGWTLPIHQNWWGHRAEKKTLLYIVGCLPRDIPVFPLVLGEASHVVGLFSGRDRSRSRPGIGTDERMKTPPDLARWLFDLAFSCSIRRAA